MTAACRGCGAPVVWALTLHGSRQPFDREPNPDGNRALLTRGDGPPLAVPREAVAGDRITDARLRLFLWMPHYATCSDAERFRGR